MLCLTFARLSYREGVRGKGTSLRAVGVELHHVGIKCRADHVVILFLGLLIMTYTYRFTLVLASLFLQEAGPERGSGGAE